MKHTKGKWAVETSATGISGETITTEYFVRRDGDDLAIASEITDPYNGQPSKANACLISAAPDLLDACKALESVFVCECQNFADVIQPALNKARLAIKKATLGA